jgi:Ca2+-binding EF-hand superfamily protein
MTNSGKEDDKLDEKPPQITAEEALDIIKEYDLDGDERLNFDEFQKLLMDQSDHQMKEKHYDL